MKKLLFLLLFMVGSVNATETGTWRAYGVAQYQHSNAPMSAESFWIGGYGTEALCNSAVADQDALYPDGTVTPGSKADTAKRAVDAICHFVSPLSSPDNYYIVGSRQVRAGTATGTAFDVKIGPFSSANCLLEKAKQVSLTLQNTPLSGQNVGTSLIASCKQLGK